MPANVKTDVFRIIDMRGGDRTQCWPCTNKPDKDGRHRWTYTDEDGKQRKEYVYRTVFELVYGVKLTPDQFVLHQCDNEWCCNPYDGHACKIGTHQDNMNEMKERERHGLQHEIVRIIKRLLATKKLTHTEIAGIVGKSRQLITEIARGTVYKHVEIDCDQRSITEGAGQEGDADVQRIQVRSDVQPEATEVDVDDPHSDQESSDTS